MPQQRVIQLNTFIEQKNKQIAELAAQLALVQDAQEKLALNHKLEDARDQLESYEEELTEIGISEETEYINILTTSNFEQQVLQNDLPVFIDLWAEWCGPCKQLLPLVEELAEEFAGKIYFGKLNVDEEPQVASLLDVQSLPTLLVMQHRRVIDRFSGGINFEQMRSRLHRIANL